ncbi:hypothetical protein [Jiella avicenniae]|uniref:HEPN domain-containing protein n=1 Tax=Jiella avicenniae TaxID=2907202 RepID=A0A9X1P5Q3_9HYPH|nr:hypothetical protein [Jiella avicenniae]MCE7030254.1 hypothetical protein [Jiella avicenniae]
MIEVADLLTDSATRNNAARRRAISTAYYAVFHALAKLCADYITRSASRSSPEYQRVYRALEHGPLKTVFSRVPLKDRDRLARIGETLVILQTERHRADYMPSMRGLFSLAKTRELVDLAREAVHEIETIEPGHEDRRTLAICLLFKERSQ